MGGPVLGGGVIVLVAVALWLVYLLPSWYSRHQYTSSERNAVRLSQALRVLAETSETPREVRLELTARTALAQQRLARRVQAEREQAELAAARASFEVARQESLAERDAARAAQAAAVQAARAERDVARAAQAAAAEHARAERRAALDAARAARRAARSAPAVRRARARRRVRLAATLLALAGLAGAGLGVGQIVVGGAATLVWAGLSVTAVSGILLRRMSRVAARAVVDESVAPAARMPARVSELVEESPRSAAWVPRELPRPLVSSAGSRAAAVLDARDAREALRAAARDEAARELAEETAPPRIAVARAARENDFARMGYVDDAEIEDHVRRLLARRAAGM